MCGLYLLAQRKKSSVKIFENDKGRKEETMYSPLVELLFNELPQAEEVLDVFKRASKKGISLNHLGFKNQFYTLLSKANLSSRQLKELNKYMKRGAQYFNKRHEEINEGIWSGLATYVYHSALIEEAREKAPKKLTN